MKRNHEENTEEKIQKEQIFATGKSCGLKS